VMAWMWVLHDANGSDMRVTEGFATKEEAEAWMGENWSGLLEEGAETVSLRNGEKHEYRMGLREA
jgi:hypothetical protein